MSAYVPPAAPTAIVKTDEQQLRTLAQQFVRDYPDLHDQAYLAAEKIIHQHTGQTLNPDQVYWHRFDTPAVGSSVSFTGWVHHHRPWQSMTFTELLMRRFDVQDQDAPNGLPIVGGFYTDGPDHEAFDESNEVKMLPQDVLNDFWALDFSEAYVQKMQRFWHDHSETFCVLAKTRYVSAAANGLRHGQLSLDDYRLVASAVTTRPMSVTTLNELRGPAPATPGVSVHGLTLAGVQAHGSLRIVSAQGRQVLYLPMDAQPFRAFNDIHELQRWLAQRFVGAVLDASSVDPQHGSIAGDPFVWLREVARQEMIDHGAQLTSNSDLRKQMWFGYLMSFIQAFGGMAPLGWPIALTLVGASLVSTGLSIDQAINGKTEGQRRAGVLSAILNAIFLLCNLPLLMSMRPVASAVLAVDDAAAALIVRAVPSSTSTVFDALYGLEGNVILDSAALSTSPGKFQGIYTLSNGQHWIMLNQLPYRTLFNETLQCWTIIAPDNVFAFTGIRPVSLSAQGQWSLLESPGLRGGSPMEVASTTERFATVASPFWDQYMLFNLYDEEWMSEQALARQKNMVEIFQLEPNEVVFSDSEGEDVHIDQWGAKHRVFRTDNGDYVGAHIQRYTQEDDAYNVFLRTGVSQADDQVASIEQLADDVATLGYNNDVELYRGGSGKRGTSGEVFRSGRIEVGDVLVNTDVTSFSENPYQARTFASSQAGVGAAGTTAPLTFDDTSVVFKLPPKSYLGASPIAPFSASPSEAESIFMPGHYFEISSLKQVRGEFYHFMEVTLREVDGPLPARGLYDLRTGEPFSRAAYAARLGPQAQVLVDRFFALDIQQAREGALSAIS